MGRPIAELRNLGPVIQTKLAHVGVRSEDDLRTLGAVAAFLRLRSTGERVSLIALYAMDAALQDRHWLDLDPERKRELKAAAAFDGEDL
jgi:TfoX/Sxy family transcriptional regulator of competence genes